MTSVLVSGASIAGPTTAAWLSRAGTDVTVVERADDLRDEGQNIDVRGAAREVLRRMGLEEAALAHGTGEQGTVFLGEGGRELARFAASTDDTSGPTAELEILRGRLGQLLFEHTGTTSPTGSATRSRRWSRTRTASTSRSSRGSRSATTSSSSPTASTPAPASSSCRTRRAATSAWSSPT